MKSIYEMNKAADSKSPLIEFQKVVDNLLAFYGMVDDQIDNASIRNIIKSGKRIERIDLYARLGVDKKELKREVERMVPRVIKSGLDYDKEKLSLIEKEVGQDKIDYYRIVGMVETIL